MSKRKGDGEGDGDFEASLSKRSALTDGDFVGDDKKTIAYKNWVYEKACVQGDLEAVKFFVELGCDPQKPISMVCKAGHVDVLKYLVSAGADARINNDWALQQACQYGHINLAQELVQTFGANVNTNHNAPLRRAIEFGNLDLVKFLVEYGAYDNEAVGISCWWDHLDIARYLRSLDQFSAQEVNSFTVLYVCENGALDTIKFLISIGAKMSTKIIVDRNKVLAPNGLATTTPAQLLRKAVAKAKMELYDCLLQLICD